MSKIFEINTTEYERRVTKKTYHVEADNEDDAMERVENGEAVPTKTEVGDIEYDTGEEIVDCEEIEQNL